MNTDCNQFVLGFHPLKQREIRAQFDGGAITSDGGGLLLREVEKRIGILQQFAACFTDYRNADLIEHTVQELVAQRVYGLALGYEDLDLDATDDPLHGKQEGRFFHGYYGHYCYLPLYIFCGEFLLGARLRSSNIDASAGSVEELKRIVAQIRSVWSGVRIVVRGDSGFCREELMAWCEAEGVDYLLGLAKNERLKAEIEKEMGEAKAQHQETGRAARLFKELLYQTRKSWSRARRVVAKAEHLEKGRKPAIRGDLSEYRSMVSAGVVRRTVLCARRHGESDPGATDAVQ